MCRYTFAQAHRMYSTLCRNSECKSESKSQLQNFIDCNVSVVFISYNVPLWWGMLRVGEAEHVRIKGIWELSAFSTQFYCCCKTAPKR